MEKNKLNTQLREYARTLSPKITEQKFVEKIYESVNNLLGIKNCIQIGSYPRFTAITPLHDLDILYFLGTWNNASHEPSEALNKLQKLIESEYKNPTSYEVMIHAQTHSITMIFVENDEEIFSVDIVPAYTTTKNEFGDDIYKVPEILLKSHEKRSRYYEKLLNERKEMEWIDSDPRGYISIASTTDKNSFGGSDFRKSVKIIKKWKHDLQEKYPDLKLKSFHLEQVVTIFCTGQNNADIYDAVFNFFFQLPEILEQPNNITDRANSDKFIDDYIEKLTKRQKEIIIQARDKLLINLENISQDEKIENVFDPSFYKRTLNEKFLFDYNIPVLTENTLRINAWVQKFGKDHELLGPHGYVAKNKKIRFEHFRDITNPDLYKWKVQNDKRSPEPRGELTDHQTKNDFETVLYKGKHYVECYSIRNGVCVAKSRQYVVLI